MSTLAVDGCHVLFKKGNMYKVIKWGWLVRFWKKEEKIVCTRDGEEHYCLVVVGSCNLMNHEEGTPLTRKLEPACRYLLSIYDWWALKLVHCCTLDACSEMKERFVPMCRKNKPPSKGLLVSAIMTTTRFHLSHVDKKKMLVCHDVDPFGHSMPLMAWERGTTLVLFNRGDPTRLKCKGNFMGRM